MLLYIIIYITPAVFVGVVIWTCRQDEPPCYMQVLYMNACEAIRIDKTKSNRQRRMKIKIGASNRPGQID